MPHKRRSTKRHHKKRTMRGGFYGASGALAPGAMEWKSSSEMGHYAASTRGGNSMIGAGRKRKGKVTRRHRKHRGGSKFGAVAASFQGTGSRGIADAVAVNTKGPAGSSAYGDWNNKGAGPGDFRSFGAGK
jgi:hypothetical protein